MWPPDMWYSMLNPPWLQWTNPSLSVETDTTAGRDVPVRSRTAQGLRTGAGRGGRHSFFPYHSHRLLSFFHFEFFILFLLLDFRSDKSGTLGRGGGENRDLVESLFTAAEAFTFPRRSPLPTFNMASTTCTRFTDEYQLYEELGK